MKKKFLTIATGAFLVLQIAKAEDEPRPVREGNADREVRRDHFRTGERELDRAPKALRIRIDHEGGRGLVGKLKDANAPNAFILSKCAKGAPRLSEYMRNSSVTTRWLVLFGRNFGVRSSLTPSFATVCSCLSNVLRGWKLAD